MSFKYPYTNLHELNLDWILTEVKKVPEFEGRIEALENKDVIEQEDIQALFSAICSHVFDVNTSYSAGSYVWHNDELYRLDGGHTVGQTWASTTHVLVPLTDELKSLFDNDDIIATEINTIEGDVSDLKSQINVLVPDLRDGSINNPANAKMVCPKTVIPINGAKKIIARFNGTVPTNGYIIFQLVTYTSGAEGLDPAYATSYIVYSNTNNQLPPNEVCFDISEGINFPNAEFFSISPAVFDESGTQQTLRAATDEKCISLFYDMYEIAKDLNYYGNQEVKKKVLNARQIQQGAGTPLTLFHFSDIHGDKSTLNRILQYANEYYSLIDGYICTGDMVEDTGGSISSWWNPKVMTCVGNHDSATKSGGVYDWDGVSMASCEAYYITPFISSWGVTHPAGTTYYYKDYNTQKVRLVVLDNMLYLANGAEATAQTAWLSSVLSDAITNQKHVIIAIHAPHNGATPVPCSFSKYGETSYPNRQDGVTPQAIVDAVQTAIGNGLNFIGYICGHVHQDDVWDAENDGKQLMYAITCAASNYGSWWYSDQYRSANEDAFNIVTIDTANTLIKIVRGGGADIDDHMRTRKGICFNYSTGQKVGEVL